MTRDDIIRMAREAGFDPHDMSDDFTCNLRDIERLTVLVAERERDECARVCEAQRSIEWVRASLPLIRHEPSNIMAEKCAAAIRARGQE